MRGVSGRLTRFIVVGVAALVVLGVAGGTGSLLAHSAPGSATATCAPAGSPMTRVRMSPQPIATAGSLMGGQSATFFAQALDGAQCIPGATIYLFEVQSVNGDSMTVSAAQCGGHTLVTSAPIACIGDAQGKVSITYKAPAVIPDNGVNEIEGGNTPTHPRANGINFYLYEMIYQFSRSPLAPNGSLAAGQTVNETLQALGVAGNLEVGFKVYLSFTTNGSNHGTAKVGTTVLTGTPKAFTTDSNAQIQMTYTAPPSPPALGIDTIFAGSGTTKTPAVFQTASYDFAASDPMISIGDEAQVEGDTHPDVLAEFDVTLNAPQTKAITLNYLTVCGIGDKGCKEDFLQSLEPTPRTLTIPAGAVSAHINIKMYSYVAQEPYNEGYFIQLLTPSSGVLGREMAQGTLLGDDETTTADILYIGDVGVVCSTSGTQFAEFTVTLSSPETSAVTFHYASQNGSALAGTDYTAVSGTATIPAGASSFHIEVPVLANSHAASTKTYMVNITSPVGATIERATGVGTILNWAGL